MTNHQLFLFSARVLALGLILSLFMGCATTSEETLQKRLKTMSDENLVSYYHGINDRLKVIQEGTREADRQGTVTEQDPLAMMPYIIGGEAWELERKRDLIRHELNCRNLKPN